MNGYALLADLIAVIHFGYVLFVLLGLLIILLGGVLRWRFIRNFWFRVVHLTMIVIVVVEALLGIMCPLTVWEYDLRVAAGQQEVSAMSFVARLIHQFLFFDFPPMVFTIAYCLLGLAILASWWLYPPYVPWQKSSSKP
jgi:hypothetical protein